MSFHRFIERTYHYQNVHTLSRIPGQQFEHISFPELEMASGHADHGSLLPMCSLALGVGAEHLVGGVEELICDRYDYPSGGVANYDISASPTMVGLVSVELESMTGMNRFVRAELLLADPSQLTQRAVGCLGTLAVHRSEIAEIHCPELIELIQLTA